MECDVVFKPVPLFTFYLLEQQSHFNMSLKSNVRKAIRKTGILPADREYNFYDGIYNKYRDFTMNPKRYYLTNLRLAQKYSHLQGDVVECGVWRGGMIAGMAEILGKDRQYHLYDSFEGLPPAKEVDGQTAIDWQKDTESKTYYDNCKAEMSFATTAMEMAGVPFQCVKGWFDETVPNNTLGPIAILRLDGDWYDSTMVCLKHLYPKVVKNGLIIMDDYYFWDGCSKATHDYLSSIQSPSRIYTGTADVAYIIKKEDPSF